MNTWQWLSLLVTILVPTAAMFRWTGRLDVLIRQHEHEIGKLRVASHAHGNDLTGHGVEIENLKVDIGQLQRNRA